MEPDYEVTAASRVVQSSGDFSFLQREPKRKGTALPYPEKRQKQSALLDFDFNEFFPRTSGPKVPLQDDVRVEMDVDVDMDDFFGAPVADPQEDQGGEEGEAWAEMEGPGFDASRMDMSSNYFLSQTRKGRVYYLANERQRKELSSMRRREDISTDPMRKLRQTPGDVRYRNLLDRLDNFMLSSGERMERSPVQKMFHRWFIQACLPWIYGIYWEACAQRVLKQHQLKRCYQEVFCITPRRFGKTLSMSTFSTALQIEICPIKIAVFSVGSRNSKLMMGMVRKFISQDENASARICIQNDECLALASVIVNKSKRKTGMDAKQTGANAPEMSEFYAFPATVDGTSFSIIILL